MIIFDRLGPVAQTITAHGGIFIEDDAETLLVVLNETLLDDLLGKFESVRAWSPRVISRLETLIHMGDDHSLFRINPIQYATEKGIAESEAIDLFLHSAKLGLFECKCPSSMHS